MNITVACPEQFSLPPFIVEESKEDCCQPWWSGADHDESADGLRGAQVVVAKSWSGWDGYSDREEESKIRKTFSNWLVDATKMSYTANAGFMHCLPVRRNVVVADEVINGQIHGPKKRRDCGCGLPLLYWKRCWENHKCPKSL